MDPVKACCKPKVVFVLGATATGKSKLAIALAARFNGEVINSDKMQVYDGVPVITNKVTEDECAGMPHHLLGGVHPDDDFTADDFCSEAARAIGCVLSRGRLPVVAGGSNTYIEALVDGEDGTFRAAHDCLFLWVDVDAELLRWYTSVRVDDMVRRGLVDEARDAFKAGADYTKGVRRAIGLPEMDGYLRAEREAVADESALAEMLKSAVDEIKVNTFKLACSQVKKIQRLRTLDGWDVHRIDSTEFFQRKAEGAGNEGTWERVVWEPSAEIVRGFLEHGAMHGSSSVNGTVAVHEEKSDIEENSAVANDSTGNGNTATPPLLSRW